MSWRDRLRPTDFLVDVNRPLLLIGVLMIVAGIAVPGAESEVVMALIVMGAGLSVAGTLASQVKQLDIGLQGIKVSQDDGTAIPTPWLAAEAETLREIADLVLGNGDSARDAVEDALTKVRRYRSQIPPGQRDLATFKTLVVELERIANRHWLRGTDVADGATPIQRRLRELPLQQRLTFALGLELPAKAVAEILDRPKAEVTADIDSTRNALAPLVDAPRGLDA